MTRKDYRRRGTPTKPKVIKRPTFNELDIGMSDPDYMRGRGIFTQSKFPGGEIPMTPKEEAENFRSFGTDFIQRGGPKGFKKRPPKTWFDLNPDKISTSESIEKAKGGKVGMRKGGLARRKRK